MGCTPSQAERIHFFPIEYPGEGYNISGNREYLHYPSDQFTMKTVRNAQWSSSNSTFIIPNNESTTNGRIEKLVYVSPVLNGPLQAIQIAMLIQLVPLSTTLTVSGSSATASGLWLELVKAPSSNTTGNASGEGNLIYYTNVANAVPIMKYYSFEYPSTNLLVKKAARGDFIRIKVVSFRNDDVIVKNLQLDLKGSDNISSVQQYRPPVVRLPFEEFISDRSPNILIIRSYRVWSFPLKKSQNQGGVDGGFQKVGAVSHGPSRIDQWFSSPRISMKLSSIELHFLAEIVPSESSNANANANAVGEVKVDDIEVEASGDANVSSISVELFICIQRDDDIFKKLPIYTKYSHTKGVEAIHLTFNSSSHAAYAAFVSEVQVGDELVIVRKFRGEDSIVRISKMSVKIVGQDSLEMVCKDLYHRTTIPLSADLMDSASLTRLASESNSLGLQKRQVSDRVYNQVSVDISDDRMDNEYGPSDEDAFYEIDDYDYGEMFDNVASSGWTGGVNNASAYSGKWESQ